MKKAIIMFAMAVLSGTALQAQQNTFAKKTITPASFDQLIIDGNMTVYLQESDEVSIKLAGSQRFVNSFYVDQHNGRMRIKSSSASFNAGENVVIVNVKNLKSIIVCGDVSVQSNNVAISPRLDTLLDAIASVNSSSREAK